MEISLLIPWYSKHLGCFNMVCWQRHLHSVLVSDASRSLSFFTKKLSFKYRQDSFGSNNKDKHNCEQGISLEIGSLSILN
ncbi:hypothetical protein OUZ56_031477 [Daphnia magna]|uniref:Uncharacterized protein n=1 Tax=Daphnia magna TaxID=35525 RepID=A0ABQ9ZUC8_9CRUS|nr:hypothetical protein OUZ56_031477 [Daphnia magna]